MSTKVYKVLHITTHCGGGIGDSIFAYFSESNKYSDFKHEVCILGYATDKVINEAKELGVPLEDHMDKKHREIIEKIPGADIVLVHIWNHPLIYDFLVRNELPPCRLIMWAHNSGLFAPNVYPEKTLLYPDIFVFTTPISYKSKEVQELPTLFSDSIGGALTVSMGRIARRKILYFIWSTAGIDKYKDIETDKHKGFIIGYVGTVDYAKLHPDFLEMCKEIIDINIPHLKFIVVGGLKEKEIEAEAKKMGMEDKFIFTGWVNDLPKYYKMFDVFGYPLASYHYGTCDLVLQIAMASGVPPVVFDNEMEKHFIKNNKTGIIVKNKEGYVQAIKNIYNNPNWHKELSRNTKEEAFKRFSLVKIESEWRKIFNKVLEFHKSPNKWDIDKKEIKPRDVFLESLGEYGKPFRSYCNSKSWSDLVFTSIRIEELAKQDSWQTETKGSVHNYHSYFPEDKYLAEWSRLMRSVK